VAGFRLTLFEYLAAGYVLMLSFAVLRAISGVPYAVRSPQRDWVYVSWLATALSVCLICFWAFWPYREVDWTLYKFVNALAIPALIYAFTSLLVPPDPSTVTSWRAHFFDVRVPLFATGAAVIAVVILSNQSALGVSPLHPSQLGNYAILAMFVIGLCSAKPSVHAGLAVALPALWVVYFVVLLAEPDSAFRAVR
jgi:hypothetical protein